MKLTLLCHFCSSIASNSSQKHWCEVKGISLNESRPLGTVALIHTDSEQYGVETTHTYTSITLNRCQLYNPLHSKSFHEFTGENRAQSHATLLYWWAHGWWIKTQLRETNGGLEKIGECPWETCAAGQKGKPVTAQEILGWLYYCPIVRTWRCAVNCYMFWYRSPSLGICVFFFL